MKNFKKVLALVLVVAMMMSFVVVASAKAYSDADKIDYKEAVDVLSYIEVLGGYPAGDFRPANNITRAEAAKIIAIFKNGDTKISELYKSANPFTDVKGDWSESYVAYCAQAGIVSGRNATTFDPKANVTGIEFLKMALVVLGFDADAEEFKGANWQTNVLAMAKEAGLLIAGWDPAKPITREEAAQVMLNALEAEKIEYGYKTSLLYPPYVAILTSRAGAVKTGDLLAEDWGLTKNAAHDVWGRPGHNWKKGAAVIGFYADAPVASYTVATKNCDILKDLGLKAATASVTDYKNGTDVGAYTIADNATKIGAQGRLVEVYKTAAGIEIVEIATHLAQVKDVLAEKVDANGHVQKAACIKIESCTNGEIVYAAGNDYAKNDYVLVYINDNTANNVTFKGVASSKYIEVLGKANTIQATQKSYNYVKETSTFDTDTYTWAQKYVLGKPGTNGKMQNLYFDQYGNLIGIAPLAGAKNTYGLILEAAWTNSYKPLEPAYAAANFMMIDGKETGAVVIDEFLTNAANPSTVKVPGDPTKASFNMNVEENTAYYDHLYEISIGTDGAYTVVDEGADLYGESIKQAKSQLFGTFATNDDTVYLVKTIEAGKAVYTVYEGYKAVPTMDNVDVCYFEDGTYVTMAYVDASAATYVGNTFLAYIYDDVVDEVAGSLNAYEMYIDGEQKFIPVEKAIVDLATAGFSGEHIYEVETNADGEITGLNKINFALNVPPYVAEGKVGACDGTAMVNDAGTKTWNVTNAKFYAISATGSVAEAAYDEIIGLRALIVLNADGIQADAVYFYN